MQIDKDILSEILNNCENRLGVGDIKAVYDEYFRNDKGAMFVQSLINLGYTPEQIIDKMHKQSFDRVNTNLFRNIEFPERYRKVSVSGIDFILDEAFKNSNVKEVVNTQDITKIGVSAFEGSTLESISLPSIEKISTAAFANCKNLMYVELGENLQSIDLEAFANCPNLKLISFDGSINSSENIFQMDKIFTPGLYPSIGFKK